VRASEAFEGEVATDRRQSAARCLDDGVPGASHCDIDEWRGGIVEDSRCAQAIDVRGAPVFERVPLVASKFGVEVRALAAVLRIAADRLLVEQYGDSVDDREPVSAGADCVGVKGEFRAAVRAAQESCQHGLA
jgi:hypothetical protein